MHRFDALEHRRRRRPEGGFEQPPVRDPLLQRVADCARLLVDLLEHEVPVRALLGRVSRQLAVLDRPVRGIALAVDHAHAVALDSATSPSSRNMKRRVTGSSAATSEATKFSSTPSPSTTGQPTRATMIRSGSPSLTMASA